MAAFLRVIISGRQKFRQQQNDRGQQSLGSVIKECILTVVRAIAGGVDNGFGDDLGILLRLGFGSQIVFILSVLIHVFVHQMQQVVSI